jgi:hypothetical protein
MLLACTARCMQLQASLPPWHGPSQAVLPPAAFAEVVASYVTPFAAGPASSSGRRASAGHEALGPSVASEGPDGRAGRRYTAGAEQMGTSAGAWAAASGAALPGGTGVAGSRAGGRAGVGRKRDGGGGDGGGGGGGDGPHDDDSSRGGGGGGRSGGAGNAPAGGAAAAATRGARAASGDASSGATAACRAAGAACGGGGTGAAAARMLPVGHVKALARAYDPVAAAQRHSGTRPFVGAAGPAAASHAHPAASSNDGSSGQGNGEGAGDERGLAAALPDSVASALARHDLLGAVRWLLPTASGAGPGWLAAGAAAAVAMVPASGTAGEAAAALGVAACCVAKAVAVFAAGRWRALACSSL